MNARTVLFAGAMICGLAVITGAFGAHALAQLLDERGKADTYELAVRYQFFHGLGLLMIGAVWLTNQELRLRTPSILMLTGVVLFSGSLYLLALTDFRWVGPVTPVGGLSLVAGWASLAATLVKAPK
jgi:uncharacterized membrane protein YgdD (TMEM256/DUF423 family)